jgi:hypothetical protein
VALPFGLNASLSLEENLKLLGVDWKQAQEYTKSVKHQITNIHKDLKGQEFDAAFEFVLSGMQSKMKKTHAASAKKEKAMKDFLNEYGKTEEVKTIVENFNAFFEQPEGLTDDIEAFLEEHDLTIGKDRFLETECHFHEITKVRNYMKKDKLKHFLASHPGQHLAIYSFEDDKGEMKCVYIVDLYNWVQFTRQHPFSKEQVVLIGHWYQAYMTVLSLLQGSKKERDQITHLSRLLRPQLNKKNSSWLGGIFAKGKKVIATQFKNLMNVAMVKIIGDIIAAFACFVLKGITLYSFWNRELLEKLGWAIFQKMLVGELITRIFNTVRTLFTGEHVYSSLIDQIGNLVGYVFPQLSGFVFGILNRVCTLAPKTTFVVLSGVGASIGGILVAVATGYLAAPAALLMVFNLFPAATSAWKFLGYIETAYQQMSLSSSLLNPLESDYNVGLSFLLQCAAPNMLCKLLSFGSKSVTTICEKMINSFLKAKMVIGLLHIIVDIILDVMEAAGVDLHIPGYKTRCSRMFSSSFQLATEWKDPTSWNIFNRETIQVLKSI